MMGLHILFSRNTRRLPFPAEYIRDPSYRVLAECCYRRIPANEATAQYFCQEIPLGDMGDYQRKNFDGEPENYLDHMAYEDARLDFVCSEGFGCTVKPRLKCGATARMGRVWGP